MATTLTTLRDRVEQVLADTGNAIWATADLDEAIRQALHEYSRARPLAAVTTLTLSASGREISVSTVTGLLDVTEVWVPYTAASPEYPPNIRGFIHWPDLVIVRVNGDYEPAAGDVVRLFYTKLHTLNALDSASATTFPENDDSVLVTGAAGYAATGRALDLAEKVTIDRLTSQQVRAWGLSKLQEFRSKLRGIARSRAGSGGNVELPPLDKWDRPGATGVKW